MALSPTSIPADGISTTQATANVTDSTGGVAGDSVSFTNQTGPTTDNGDGTYTATIQSTTTPGQVTITATDSTSGISGSATLTQIGPPAHLTLTLAPQSITADGISSSTATATVTDSAGHALAGESVDFTDAGNPVNFSAPSCITGQTGSCGVAITGTTAGFTTVTATDSNPAGSSPTRSKTLAETAPVPAQVGLQLSPSTIIADGLSTATAVATVTDAGGHAVTSANVSFKSSDPGQSIGGVTNNGDGTYTVQIRSSTTVGSSTITATAGPASQTATLIQASGPSTTTLVSSSSSLVTNEGVTLVATVSGGTGAPSGTITFENGGVTILGCGGEAVSPSSLIATCQTTFAASASPARLTAVFTPGPGSTAPGSTGSLTLSIGPDSTSMDLQVPSSATTGGNLTYVAQVSPPAIRPGPIEPSGPVQFYDNGQTIPSCASQPLVNGTAACTVNYKRARAHVITARYGGDANFSGSFAAPAHFSVVALRAPIIGSLSDTMQWVFHFTSSFTKVRQLIVNGASPGDTIRVTCHGRGCPFKKRTMRITARRRCALKHGKRTCTIRRGSTSVTVPPQGRRLSPGATVTVSITRPNWIGKYYAFTMRARRGPRIRISCLTPGYSKPGVGCST